MHHQPCDPALCHFRYLYAIIITQLCHILEMQQLQEISVPYRYSAYRLLSQAPQISCVIWHCIKLATYVDRHPALSLFCTFSCSLQYSPQIISLPNKIYRGQRRWKKSCNRPYLTRFRPLLLPKTSATAYHFTSVDSSWAVSTSRSHARNRRYRELVFVPTVKLILT